MTAYGTLDAMQPFSFRPDRKITDVFRKQPFTLSAEIIPPRNGSDQNQVLTQIDALVQAGAQFLAVTKGAGGSLRGGSLPIAQTIKERFSVPCIAHFTCRDLTPVEVENQLIDHHYFGIRNILALRGDPPDGQPHWEPKPGGYSYAYQLIEQIRNLNSGIYLPRAGGPQPDGHEKTDFCIGAAAYPDYPNESDRIGFFKLKVDAGAEFGISDMLFDPESYARFMDLCAKNRVHIPILPGSRVLKTKPLALKMCQKFRVQIPQATLDALPEKDGPDTAKIGIELFMKLVDRLKALGAPGIHLYVIADTNTAAKTISSLSQIVEQSATPVL